MGKTLKYVKDFDFGPEKTYVSGYARGGCAKKADGGAIIALPRNQKVANIVAVKKTPVLLKRTPKVAVAVPAMKKGGMYAEGGMTDKEDIAQDKAMIRTAVHKHERAMHPGKPMTKLRKGGVLEKATGERYPSREAMVKHESMETPMMQKQELVERSKIRRGVPIASQSPLLAMKQGGVPKAGAYKVPKVMHEFKSGELHSGSKSGPVVKSRKQAIAIALSEARKAGKK